MTDEVIQWLNCRSLMMYADCTLGGGGHSRAILDKMGSGGVLICIDRDADAIEHARQTLKADKAQIYLFHGNYSRLPEFVENAGIRAVDGIIADLGLSLHQLEGSGRGFSFNRDEPLDMRMDVQTEITAEYLVNTLETEELARIFKTYGEENRAKAVAKAIVRERAKSPIRSSKQLAERVCKVIPKTGKQRIHPATRVFMALRIAVNRELEDLETFMREAPKLLNPGGRLCVISFHSLEDRIVKQSMRAAEKDCICPGDFPQCVCNAKKTLTILTRKALRPSEEEVIRNPMARSAKLRVAEKV
jgi:16S rRNA (cytosine1402-N4)-methyltransferase